MEPQVKEGDVLCVEWMDDRGVFDKFRCKIIKVKRSSKVKHGSAYKYSLEFMDGLNETRTTRLANLKWSFAEQDLEPSTKRVRRSVVEGISPALTDSALRFICAPMVGASELAFRLLTRRYGATLAYTPMINSARFATDAVYRAVEFQTTPEDRPLVAHFSANDPQHLLAAAKLVENQCDAIDLNLGCPQRVAFQGHFGSFLLEEVDRPLVLDMIKTCSQGVSIPVFVKIRLLDTVPDTIRLCEQLAQAGAALIAIHARYRVNLAARTGPGARDGAAHLEQVTAIRKHMKTLHPCVKIIANGNIRCYDDCVANLQSTLSDGVMSAEALLDNPALFYPSVVDAAAGGAAAGGAAAGNAGTAKGNHHHHHHHHHQQHQQQQPTQLALAQEYLCLADAHGPVKLKSLVFHTRRIVKDLLTKYQLMDDCVNSKSLADLSALLDQIAAYEDGSQSFAFDREKAAREKEALERRKREEGKRTAFEDRMRRKAKREGKSDPLFYLQTENPTVEELDAWRARLNAGDEAARAAAKEDVFAMWKQRHSQHCWDFHFNPKGCHRDRTCSFLHVDASFTSHHAEAYG